MDLEEIEKSTVNISDKDRKSGNRIEVSSLPSRPTNYLVEQNKRFTILFMLVIS